MNKFQKRKNTLKKYRMFLTNDKMNEIIDNDKQYTNFLKLMNLCEDTSKKLIEKLYKSK